jgi:hypothetical protein
MRKSTKLPSKHAAASRKSRAKARRKKPKHRVAKTPAPLGRPTDYRPDFCELAANLCVHGATDFEVAEALGVFVSTVYRWKARYPDFCEALKVGKELADDRVEFSLYHRAVGYSHHAVKIMQNMGVPLLVPYTEHVPPDAGAATMWLTNRRGDTWRTKQLHELTGKDGAALLPVLNVIIHDRTEPAPVADAGTGVSIKSD